MAFTLSDLVPAAIAIVVAAIAIGMGSKVLSEVQGTESSTVSGLYNSTTEGINGLQDMAEFLPTVAIVVVAAIIIGIVVYYFR